MGEIGKTYRHTIKETSELRLQKKHKLMNHADDLLFMLQISLLSDERPASDEPATFSHSVFYSPNFYLVIGVCVTDFTTRCVCHPFPSGPNGLCIIHIR